MWKQVRIGRVLIIASCALIMTDATSRDRPCRPDYNNFGDLLEESKLDQEKRCTTYLNNHKHVNGVERSCDYGRYAFSCCTLCYKGPGETCDHSNDVNLHGKCHRTLTCSGHKCQGCSSAKKKLECYPSANNQERWSANYGLAPRTYGDPFVYIDV